MAFKNVLSDQAEGARTDETGDSAGEGADTPPEMSPFSMSYDLSSYNVDSETIDHGLSIAVAITNLL